MLERFFKIYQFIVNMNNMKNFEEEIFNWPLYCDRKLDEKKFQHN